MPFTTKQSDVFFNEETKQMYVCTVSSVTADRCEGVLDEIVYGALPILYKIDKDTNYKSVIYPKNLDTFTADVSSDIFNVTPSCPEGTNFNTITKPLINYNKTTDRYSITFLGKYTTDVEGAAIANFVFQDINTNFYLLDSKFYIPKAKFTNNPYTFANGYLNSDFVIGGNTIRNNSDSYFGNLERSPEYLIIPSHVQSVSSLGFNIIVHSKNTVENCLIGDTSFPFMYSGGYITYNPKYTAFDPEYNIRVDFRARCFNTPTMTAYGSTQDAGGASASRWAEKYVTDGPGGNIGGGPGEGFCVYFHEAVDPAKGRVAPNGVGSTLGYSQADFNINEVAGTAQRAEGLYVNTTPGADWSKVTGIVHNVDGNIGGNVGQVGYQANAFLGVGFDVGGNFCLKTEDKTGWYQHSGGVGTHTQAPCSVGIRGSRYHDTEVLTCVPMSSVPTAGDIPMHVSGAQPDGSDVAFVDYRIDLSNRGQKVTVYNKEPADTEYNIITEFRLSKPSKAGVKYDPWKRIGTQVDGEWGKELVPLNVGLTFTTSNNCSFFELSSFEVTGVKINNPYIAQKKGSNNEDDLKGRINYIEQSSKNLREKLVKIKSDDKLDIDLTIPARNRLADIEHEKNIRDRITLCDGTKPEIMEDDMTARITGITPEEADKLINLVETGEPPGEHIHTHIKPRRKLIPTEIITTSDIADHAFGVWNQACRTTEPSGLLVPLIGKEYQIDIGTEDPATGKDYIKVIGGSPGHYWTTWMYLQLGKCRFYLHTVQHRNMISEYDHVSPGLFDTEWGESLAGKKIFANKDRNSDEVIISNTYSLITEIAHGSDFHAIHEAQPEIFDWKINLPTGHRVTSISDIVNGITPLDTMKVLDWNGDPCSKAQRINQVGGEDLPADQGGTVYSGFQGAVVGGGVGPGQKSVVESDAYKQKDTVTTLVLGSGGEQEEGELNPVNPNDNEEDESTETGDTNSDDGGGNDGGGDTGDDGAIEADPE